MDKKISSFKKLALNFTNRVLDNYKPDNSKGFVVL